MQCSRLHSCPSQAPAISKRCVQKSHILRLMLLTPRIRNFCGAPCRNGPQAANSGQQQFHVCVSCKRLAERQLLLLCICRAVAISLPVHRQQQLGGCTQVRGLESCCCWRRAVTAHSHHHSFISAPCTFLHTYQLCVRPYLEVCFHAQQAHCVQLLCHLLSLFTMHCRHSLLADVTASCT
jgi:hypothetical protein